MIKKELRQEFRGHRATFHKNKNAAIDSALAVNLRAVMDLFSPNSIWAIYRAYGTEVDPAKALNSSGESRAFAYPVVTGSVLSFYVPNSATQWTKSDLGIEEPNPDINNKISLSKLNGVFVPGLAFDKVGGRLGSGKGFYDQTLTNYQGPKVGVAYSVQITDGVLPTEAHDIRMDIIVTEKEVIYVNERIKEWKAS